MESDRIKFVFDYFKEIFGSNPKCELNYSSDIELLVAIILSAQCTDKRVNIVTKSLFNKFRSINDFANADSIALEKYIYSTGFYHNKAKNIISLCKLLRDKFNCEIPKDITMLEQLPGIGRKTASVFLSEFHNIPAIAVDTHVNRVSNRLGFTKSNNPKVIESDLALLWDTKNWGKYHLYMVMFGRYNCMARNPLCQQCKLKQTCIWFDTKEKKGIV